MCGFGLISVVVHYSPVAIFSASRKKKAKTGNATVAIVNNKTTDASDGNGSDENCDAIQRTSEISTHVQEKDKVAIRPRPTARSTSRQAAKAERMGTADKAMAEGSEIQRELERDVEVSTRIAKSSLREGKQKKEKKSSKKKNVLQVVVEGCVPGREAERCPGAAQLSVRDGKRKEENRNSKRKKDIPTADTPRMKTLKRLLPPP